MILEAIEKRTKHLQSQSLQESVYFHFLVEEFESKIQRFQSSCLSTKSLNIQMLIACVIATVS